MAVRGRLLPLWLMTAAYALILGLRWTALPHALVIHCTRGDAPSRFLPRPVFAVLTLAILCAVVALATCLLPREGEYGRGAATLAFGFCYGLFGFIGGVFWSLVRINASLGSPVRPAVATALALAAFGLILGVSAPAPLPARFHHPPAPE